MKHESILRPPAQERQSLARDFQLIVAAMADAFRALSAGSPLESRWSKLHNCGCSF